MVDKPKKKTMQDILHQIAEALINRYNFKTISGKKTDEIYVYINGVYEEWGKDAIKIEVEKQLGSFCKTHGVNEVINKIARKTLVERESMGCKDTNLICLTNGVLNIKKNKLLPHSPDYRFLSKIPILYDIKADSPKIIKFFEEILYEKDVSVMQELIGYLLYREYFIKKGIIFVGEGDTGKTTCLNLLSKFIGVKNISGISLHKLSNDKFSGAHLYHKHANLYDDLSSTDITDTGTFKIATGGGYITGEFKFGNQFQFKNFAKLIFATNKIPSTKVDEEDLAYYKRWIIFRFEEVFDGNNNKVDKKIIEKLTTPSEMSGLLNWGIIGLKRLLKKEDFSYSKDLREIKELIQIHSSDIAKFVHECCEKGSNSDWLSKEEMYEQYKEYSGLNNLASVTKELLGRKLPNFCDYILDSREGQKTGWRFIKVKEVKPIFGV